MSENLIQYANSNNEILNYFKNEETLKSIKNMVAKNATDEEFIMFRELAVASQLNPFKREIWFIKPERGSPQIMTGLNGFLKIANTHPAYDGMVKEEILDKNGKLIGAKVSVYRKDRKYPSEGIALLSEYAKPSGQWPKMPHTMIFKVAMCKAIREAFEQECNGLYTEEEMPDQYAAKNVVAIQEPENLNIQEIKKALEAKEFLKELEILIESKKAWSYAPLSYDDEEGSHLIKNAIKDKVFISDKENKCVWLKDSIPELEIYCRHKPIAQE